MLWYALLGDLEVCICLNEYRLDVCNWKLVKLI